MITEPKDLSELLNYSKEAIVIDLLPHVMALDEEMLNALIGPPRGLYLVGSIEPTLSHGKDYYPKSQWGTGAPPIDDFSKITDYKEEIVSSTMETVLSPRDLALKSKYFRNEPTVPVMGMKAAIGIVEQYIVTTCRHSKRLHPSYRLEYLVKSEYRKLIDNDEYMHAFEKLLDQVMSFIGEDNWSLYFTKIKGTSLIIEKGIDYRIYVYYENLFRSQEPQEE